MMKTLQLTWLSRRINSTLLLLVFLFLAGISKGQVTASQYTFSMSSGTYTDISGTGTYIGNGDDSAWFPFPIGFTFTYHCVDFTTFGVTTNGFLRLGAKPPAGSNSVNYQFAAGTDATDSNTIGGLSADLYYMYSHAGKIWYQTTGPVGSRVCTIEWQHMYFWGASADYSDDANFQIQLFEGTNVISIVYGNAYESGHYNRYPQIGIRGVANTDYNLIDDAGGTLQWTAVTATTSGGNTLSKLWGISNSNEPTLGLTYTWTPPVGPCTPTALTTQTNNVGKFIVYSDYSRRSFTMKISSDLLNSQLTIYDALGRSVLQTKIVQEQSEINISSLSKGVYIIRLLTPKGLSMTKRIVQ